MSLLSSLINKLLGRKEGPSDYFKPDQQRAQYWDKSLVRVEHPPASINEFPNSLLSTDEVTRRDERIHKAFLNAIEQWRPVMIAQGVEVVIGRYYHDPPVDIVFEQEEVLGVPPNEALLGWTSGISDSLVKTGQTRIVLKEGLSQEQYDCVILHELGHALMGGVHSSDKRDVMHPTSKVTKLSEGDKIAVKKWGAWRRKHRD